MFPFVSKNYNVAKKQNHNTCSGNQLIYNKVRLDPQKRASLHFLFTPYFFLSRIIDIFGCHDGRDSTVISFNVFYS